MGHGVTHRTRLRIGVAQFIRNFSRDAVPEVTAGRRDGLDAGLSPASNSSGTWREHLSADVAVIDVCPIAL